MRRINKAVYICLIAMLSLLMSVNTQAAVKLNKKTAAIIQGSTISLKVTGTKSKAVWESSKPKVASVNSNGVVKGLTVGTATIKAKIGKKTYNCKVTVENPKINKASLTVEIKKSVKLKITGTKQKVKWSSSNKKVATVTSKGIVKGINGGKAIITATVGEKKLTCSVTVPALRISNTSANLEVGKTIQLRIAGSSQKVTWKSSNKKIATVTNKGVVKGVRAGTATITATVVGKKCTCKVTVKEDNHNSERQAALKAYKEFLSTTKTYRFRCKLNAWREKKEIFEDDCIISVSDCYFDIVDIDQNGIPELVIKQKSHFYGSFAAEYPCMADYYVFTFNEGKISTVARGGLRQDASNTYRYNKKRKGIVLSSTTAGSDLYYCASMRNGRIVDINCFYRHQTYNSRQAEDHSFINGKVISPVNVYYQKLYVFENEEVIRTVYKNTSSNRNRFIKVG